MAISYLVSFMLVLFAAVVPFASSGQAREYHVAVQGGDRSQSLLAAGVLAQLQRYLNLTAGTRFDPAVNFVVREHSAGLETYAAPEANKLDFVFADSAVAACIESEARFAPMLTFRSSAGVEVGGVVVVRRESGVTNMQDLRDKVVAASDWSLIYQHQRVMEAQGFCPMTMAAQVRIGGRRIIEELLEQRADAAIVRSALLEAPAVAGVRDRLRIVGAATRDMANGQRFPFPVTSDLLPESTLMTAPHVRWEIQREVTIALLQLHLWQNRSNWTQLSSLRFQPALSYSAARDAIQFAGLLRLAPSGRFACGFGRKSGDVYNSFSCPKGSYKKREELVLNGCPTNLTCPPDQQCLCRPCELATFEVTVVVVATHDHWEEHEHPELYEEKNLEAQFEECRKMQKCGIMHQREELQYIITDHLLRPQMRVLWRLRRAASSYGEQQESDG